jgi:hypothetical protein
VTQAGSHGSPSESQVYTHLGAAARASACAHLENLPFSNAQEGGLRPELPHKSDRSHPLGQLRAS